MLILTSNGLSSDNLIKRAKQYCTTLNKAVIVTTASVEYKENNYHIPRLTEELNSLGLSVELFDFDFQNPELLLNYDVVEINGGKILSSVSSNLNYLVAGEKAGSKLVKAEKIASIQIIDEAEFLEMIS